MVYRRSKKAVCACLTWLVGACAQGGSNSGPGWPSPADNEPDASAGESANSEAGSAPATFVPSSVPPASSGAATSSPPSSGPPPAENGDASVGSADNGEASVDSQAAALDPTVDDASAGDPEVQDASSFAPSATSADSSSPPLSGTAAPEPIDAAPAPQSFVALGDLLVTEVMFAPFGERPQSEWFEVYNAGTSPVVLSGLTIIDGSMDAHTIAADTPVLAPVSTYILLVRDRAVAIANGLPSSAIVYEYGAGLSSDQGIQLDDEPTGAVSLWNGGLELAGAPYGSWGLVALGQSLELATLQLVGSDVAESWCYAEYPWAPSSDFGTPGAPNDCQSAGSP